MGKKQDYSNKLDNLINKGQWKAFSEELQNICGIITFNNFTIDDEFINKVRQNKMDSFGTNYELRSTGKGYLVDWKAGKKETKEVITCAGKKVQVDYVICQGRTEAQVPKVYKDVLSITEDKTISIFIDKDEARKIACGENTYNELIALIESKLPEAVRDYVYEVILCSLNDPENYKKIEKIHYCSCSGCDGTTLMGAIKKFALRLQRNTTEYNIAGNDYYLPINKQWLITSYDLDGKITDIMANTYHKDINNPISNFGFYHTLDIGLADAIFMDERYIQYHEMVQNTYSNYNTELRGNCITLDYIARRKNVNFLVGVPVKFVKVECKDIREVNDVIADLQDISNNIEVNDKTQEVAEGKLKELVDKVNKKNTTIETETLTFVEPTENKKGFILTKFTVKNATYSEIYEKKTKLTFKKKEE